MITKRFDPLATRFVDAPTVVYPEQDRDVRVWRYFFMVGAVLLDVSEVFASARLESVSEGTIGGAILKDLRIQLSGFLSGALAVQ